MNLLIYYVFVILIVIFSALPFITSLGSSCGSSYIQCLPAADQVVKNFYGSNYVAGQSEYQYGQTILIVGIIVLWFLIPFLFEAVYYLSKSRL